MNVSLRRQRRQVDDSRESIRKSIYQIFRAKWANKWKKTMPSHKRI